MRIKKDLLNLGEYYGKILTPNQLQMYSEVLVSLPYETFTASIKKYINNASNVFFPLPGQLIGITTGDDKDHALEAVEIVLKAMSKFGSYADIEKVKEFVGPLGWQLIKSEGGWNNICASTTYDKLPILKAQWRESCKSFLARETAHKITDNTARLENKETLKLK